jgi:hypothetical protein
MTTTVTNEVLSVTVSVPASNNLTVTGENSTTVVVDASQSVSATITDTPVNVNLGIFQGPDGPPGMTAPKSFTLVQPEPTDSYTLFYLPYQITLTNIQSVIKGTTSVGFKVFYGPDRSAAGTSVSGTNPIVCDNNTVGDPFTAIENPTIPANNYVWFSVTNLVGTPDELHVSLIF